MTISKTVLLTLIFSLATLLTSCDKQNKVKSVEKDYRFEPFTVEETKRLQKVFIAGVICGRKCGLYGLSEEETKKISIKVLGEAGYQIFPPDKEEDKKKDQ